MVTERDQPRPDLDAAIDAVVPTLTAVSDEAAAHSLRRTRIALADAEPRRASAGAWRWALPAVAFTTVLIAVTLWHPRATVDGPHDRMANARPSAPPAPLPSVAPVPVQSIAAPPRALRPQRLARTSRVEAASVARGDQTPREDPLVALVHAVQQIPEAAWQRGAGSADAPVTLPPIVVTPIDTPPIPDVSGDPVAPGEH